MEKIEITKEQIFKALQSTHLSSGDAFQSNNRHCAVGAVLNHVVPDLASNELAEELVTGLQYLNSDCDGMLQLEYPIPDNGKYLNWLSIAFETLMDHYGGDLEVVRPYLIEFIEDTFPESFIAGE